MDKRLSIMLYGFDINDDEAYRNHIINTIMGPGRDVLNKQSEPDNIGIDVNPQELFKDSKESGCAADKSVVVRGSRIGDVKKVVMSPNGDIKIYHGGV